MMPCHPTSLQTKFLFKIPRKKVRHYGMKNDLGHEMILNETHRSIHQLLLLQNTYIVTTLTPCFHKPTRKIKIC
ncbi:hypothetical protein HanRHA438_Chr03g0143681 [Helianthus annuus]|nr:hypothetical protein HanRHA438_Chr03g0143681 [Helianthus annuus]